MPYKHYDWANSRSPPVLQLHSITKHRLLKNYIEGCLSDLKISEPSTNTQITIIDGFSGGGIYMHSNLRKTCLGSPFIFLNTIQKIENEINKKHKKFLPIDVVYYFIDYDRNALLALEKQLYKRGYGKLLGTRIFLLQGRFASIFSGLSEIVKHRGGKLLFFLDQYGYKDVPLDIINNIFNNFRNVDVLLTFAVGSLINYITDTPRFYKCVSGKNSRYNILSGKDISSLLEKKNKVPSKNMVTWRNSAEQKILKRIRNMLKCCNCIPYPIISKKSNRCHWLLHFYS